MNNPKILIVDDEHNVQYVLIRALEKFEYQISTATSGQEAIDLISETNFDVIILDLRLPDIDGIEVLNRIDAVGNRLDVVMITAHGNIDVAVEAMKNGCVDFLQKPFEIEEIRKVLHDILTRKNLSHEQSLRFESLIEVAKIETKDRHYSKAIKLVKEAIKLMPEHSDAYNFLGVLYEILADYQKAIKAYKQASLLDSKNENAKANLERVQDLSLGTGMIFR